MKNVHRKDFTNFEKAGIDQSFRAMFEAEAKLRQKKGTEINPSENFAKVKGKSASKIAKILEMSDRVEREPCFANVCTHGITCHHYGTPCFSWV